MGARRIHERHHLFLVFDVEDSDYALVVGNPGKIIGWVDKKGNKIAFDSNGKSTCGKYFFDNEQVQLIKK